MGTPNDPPGVSGGEDTGGGSDGVKVSTVGSFELESTAYNSLIMGEETSLVLGSTYNLLVGTETSITAGAAVDMFLGLKVDASYASNVEWYGGSWYTNVKEGELVGRKSVEIKAGGDSTTLNTIMKLMLVLAAADTLAVGLVDFCDETLDESQAEQNYFVGFNDTLYALALAGLDIALLLQESVTLIC